MIRELAVSGLHGFDRFSFCCDKNVLQEGMYNINELKNEICILVMVRENSKKFEKLKRCSYNWWKDGFRD